MGLQKIENTKLCDSGIEGRYGRRRGGDNILKIIIKELVEMLKINNECSKIKI